MNTIYVMRDKSTGKFLSEVRVGDDTECRFSIDQEDLQSSLLNKELFITDSINSINTYYPIIADRQYRQLHLYSQIELVPLLVTANLTPECTRPHPSTLIAKFTYKDPYIVYLMLNSLPYSHKGKCKVIMKAKNTDYHYVTDIDTADLLNYSYEPLSGYTEEFIREYLTNGPE